MKKILLSMVAMIAMCVSLCGISFTEEFDMLIFKG